MALSVHDAAKRRLVERGQLVTAVQFLMANGIARHDIGEQLARYYYVDIDALNDVLANAPLQLDTPAIREHLRRVA